MASQPQTNVISDLSVITAMTCHNNKTSIDYQVIHPSESADQKGPTGV